MFLLKKLLAALVLPPAGLLLMRRRPRAGRALAWGGLAALWLLATPALTRPLLATIEDAPPLSAASAREAQAIVVLGGGSILAAPEYGEDTVNARTLERLRFASRLQRETGLPLLASGGAPFGGRPEARAMQAVLEGEFGARVRWVEERSRDTRENARFSAPLLARDGVRRAQAEFAAAGVETIAAPTGYAATPRSWLEGLLPNAEELRNARAALHELLGRLAQRLSLP